MPLTKYTIYPELADTCGSLNIRKDHILIVAGAAATIMDVRESTQDIDVEVLTLEAWETLLGHKEYPHGHYEATGDSPAADIISVGNIDFHWSGGKVRLLEDTYSSMFNGFHCQSLLELLEFRLKLRRDKDMSETNVLVKALGVTNPKVKELLNKYPTVSIVTKGNN